MPTIRNMTLDDLPVALELCRTAGWNQLEADWRRVLAVEPAGIFVAVEDGRVAGTISNVAYPPHTSWIGMVLVDPGFRRRGIGSALMARGIEYLQGRQVEAIKLDATDQGRPVYVKLGFRDERPIERCVAPLAHLRHALDENDAVCQACTIPTRHVTASDIKAFAAFDAAAFGADRASLLASFLADGRSSCAGSPRGDFAFGFARPGHLADYIGPVVANNSAAAHAVVADLIRQSTADKVAWDLLPDNAHAARLARSLGFQPVRTLTRMYLGDTMNPGNVAHTWAAAGFEFG